MKINDKVSNINLSEIGHGLVEARFAFVNAETGDTITPFCKCKDYFTDMFWSNSVKQNVQVCGFKWSPNQDGGVLDEEILVVAIAQCSRGSKQTNTNPTEKQAQNVQEFLNKFEKSLNFVPSKVELSDDKKYIVVSLDKKWSDKPYLVSALFLFMRLGLNYNDYSIDPVSFYKKGSSKDYFSPNDESYFGRISNRITDLLNGKIDKEQTYAMYTSGSAAHGSAGIVGYKTYKIL